MSASPEEARSWREYARFVFPTGLLDAVAEDRRILVAEDASGTGSLLVTPEPQARADVHFIAAIVRSTTVGDLRRVPNAWGEAVGTWDTNDLGFMYDEAGNRLDPRVLPDEYPYAVTEWFGEEYEGVLPLAVMRTAQMCPLSILARFGQVASGSLVECDVPAFMPDAVRGEVERMLSDEGYVVVRDDQLAASYMNY